MLNGKGCVFWFVFTIKIWATDISIDDKSSPSSNVSLPSSDTSQPPSSSIVLNSKVPTALPSIPGSLTHPSVLLTLREKVEKLPNTVPIAEKTHILAVYSLSPQRLTSYREDDADVWEIWDQKLNVFLQGNDDDLKQLVVRGKLGLIGLVGFFEHLVRDRKVDEGLIEGKVKRLMDVIDVYVFFWGYHNSILFLNPSPTVCHPSVALLETISTQTTPGHPLQTN